MKLTKIVCLIAVAACLFTATACKEETKQNSVYVPTSSDSAWLDHIEIEDMDGYNFRILTRPNMTNDQYVEEETGDIINDAVYRRNETVKALFNIDITAAVSSDSKAGDAVNIILAGDDQYDIILPHSRSAFQYAIQDALVNFNEVKTIDLTKEWWSKDIVDSANINGHLYVLDGDISTHRLTYGFAMYFNKRIFDELGLEYPYKMAIEGTWTFDEFSKLVKQGSKDLNGDGVLQAEYDQFGYYSWHAYGPIQVLYSGGQRIYGKNASGIPELTLNSPKTVEIFSKFFSLCGSEDVLLVAAKDAPSEDLFPAGRTMFADKGLGSAKEMRSMNDDFGILPWPKYSLEDDYHTVINGHASLLVMPVTVSDYERSGKIIEALCAIGNRDVIPAFYDVSLKTKFSRDYESEAMIDIIRESLVYDIGYISGGVFQGIGENLATLNNPDFAAHYARNESKAIADLRAFLSSYGKVG